LFDSVNIQYFYRTTHGDSFSRGNSAGAEYVATDVRIATAAA